MIKMKTLFFSLLALLLISCGTTDKVVVEENDNSEDEYSSWAFEEIERFIHEEFPEAYNEFVEIRYYRQVERVIPRDATFLIPTRYFTEGKLTQEICNKRMGNVIKKMGGEPGYCESITIGESKDYAWHSWEDKTVTKLTIDFAIGC